MTHTDEVHATTAKLAHVRQQIAKLARTALETIPDPDVRMELRAWLNAESLTRVELTDLIAQGDE